MNQKARTITQPLAPLGDRIIAYIIDFLIMQLGALIGGILVLLVWGIISLLDIGLSIPDDTYVTVLSIIAVIAIIIWFGFNIYYILFWLIRHEGQTIGKKVRKIRIMIVEDLQSGKIRKMTNSDIGVVLLRLLFTIVDSLFFFIVGIYLINSDPNMQRFADQQAKTVVVSDVV